MTQRPVIIPWLVEHDLEDEDRFGGEHDNARRYEMLRRWMWRDGSRVPLCGIDDEPTGHEVIPAAALMPPGVSLPTGVCPVCGGCRVLVFPDRWGPGRKVCDACAGTGKAKP